MRQDAKSHLFKTEHKLWPIQVDVWQKPSQYSKVTILQLNFLKKIKDKTQGLEETTVDCLLYAQTFPSHLILRTTA